MHFVHPLLAPSGPAFPRSPFLWAKKQALVSDIACGLVTGKPREVSGPRAPFSLFPFAVSSLEFSMAFLLQVLESMSLNPTLPDVDAACAADRK